MSKVIEKLIFSSLKQMSMGIDVHNNEVVVHLASKFIGRNGNKTADLAMIQRTDDNGVTTIDFMVSTNNYCSGYLLKQLGNNLESVFQFWNDFDTTVISDAYNAADERQRGC